MKSREISRSKIGPFSLACTDPYLGIGWEYQSISREHTFGDSWYRTDRLVCSFYILDFMNFTLKSVPDNCLQTHMSNTWCPKGRNFKHMAEYF